MPQVASISFVPNGQTFVVDLVGPGSAVEAFYTDTALSAAVTLPAVVSSNTTWYTGNFGGYTLSVKQPDGTELRGDVVRIAPDAPIVVEPVPSALQVAADGDRRLWGGYLASGSYYFTQHHQSGVTSSTLGNSTLRLASWIVPNAISISKIGAEVTTIGEAGSKFRIGIYKDNGKGYPGDLLLDAGQIAGDSATVQELTVDQAIPAGLYWVGGAVQSAPSTQPTMRVASSWWQPAAIGKTTVFSAGETVQGYSQASVSGALPSTFSTTVTTSGIQHVRIFVKVA